MGTLERIMNFQRKCGAHGPQGGKSYQDTGETQDSKMRYEKNMRRENLQNNTGNN